MATRRVAIIGTGMGGLAAGLLLVARGVDVVLIERRDAPGGKMRQVGVGAERLDAGPTVLTMRDVFDALFADAGTSLDAHLTLRPAATIARHAWDGDRPGHLDLFADFERSVDAVAAFAGAAEAGRFRDFTARARRTYRTLESTFIRASRPTLPGLMRRAAGSGPRRLAALADLSRISPFSDLWTALGRHFHDPRLRQLFGRYATYCGSSPFLAPATLMLVAHVEREGVWLVDGGMHAVAQSLARLIAARGGTLRYETHADEIAVRGGRAVGVVLAGGERIDADAVLMNGDVSALASGLLGRDASRAARPTLPQGRSLSAVTWNLVAETSGFAPARHNVFFSDASSSEFDDVFRRRRLPASPTVYVCAQDRAEPGDARPPGPERLLCLVNAPPTGDSHAFADEEVAQCAVRAFARMERCGLHLRRTADPAVTTTPSDFARLFPGTGGALYGAATHGWAASFRRPGSRTRLPGLYLAGGSAHPGPGVPMAALSGRLAAASILEDLAP